MKILVVGKRPETRALSRALCAGTRHFSAGRTAASALRREGEEYDLVLLEGGASTAGGREAIRAVRETSGSIPIASLSFDETEPAAEESPRLIGLFEKTPQGLRMRNCRLTTTLRSAPEALSPDAGEILFEYHAPCRKGGRIRSDQAESETS